MNLFDFQQRAATQISERFSLYVSDPLMIDRTRCVPFFQTLVSITGSGKTLILADTILQISEHLPVKPIVLWVSKGRVVVSQTLENLSSGKYAPNLIGFDVEPLLQTTPDKISNTNNSLCLVATVGKFAREDTNSDDRKIFQAQLDLATESLWEILQKRETQEGVRRPLIVVYDEAHNLSDLQTKRIMDLAPDALIAASATISVPAAIQSTIKRLQDDKGWSDKDFSTAVSSREVVESGLVKERISIDGYITPLETALGDMLSDLEKARQSAAQLASPFVPKAVYVCKTNEVEGVPISEDMKLPFEQRQARPIQIWRYLVEEAGVDPSKIAVYCQLKFDKNFPPPKSLNLFAGGDKDYERFQQGNFEHIIFNQSLQEGWDDPTCGFAYIDKSMGSSRQITQVIGRVLRQPQAHHHKDPILNTAHFHIRTDDKGVFEEILKEVRQELTVEHPAISIVVRKDTTGRKADIINPNPSRTVPIVAIDSSNAHAHISNVVDEMMSFPTSDENTIGEGSRVQVLQRIGQGEEAKYDWRAVEHSNRVTVRSIFRREISRLYPGGLQRTSGPINLVDIELAKFDNQVEVSSKAAQHVREIAKKVVLAYIDHSVICQNDMDPPYSVGPIAIDPNNNHEFQRSLHEKYSGLNPLETKFADALDRTQRVWARNPSSSGYFIPLLGQGRAYFPDFLVWVDKSVVAIDTKGDHLLLEASNSKLFDIESDSGKARIVLRLISEGERRIENSSIKSLGNSGFTVWSWKNGSLSGVHCDTEKSAVEQALAL